MKYPLLFIIHPTAWQDYDVVILGTENNLNVVKKQLSGCKVIKSEHYGCSLIVLDTTDTLSSAYKILKDYKKKLTDVKDT
jgi:hypothetical protein